MCRKAWETILYPVAVESKGVAGELDRVDLVPRGIWMRLAQPY